MKNLNTVVFKTVAFWFVFAISLIIWVLGVVLSGTQPNSWQTFITAMFMTVVSVGSIQSLYKSVPGCYRTNTMRIINDYCTHAVVALVPFSYLVEAMVCIYTGNVKYGLSLALLVTALSVAYVCFWVSIIKDRKKQRRNSIEEESGSKV